MPTSLLTYFISRASFVCRGLANLNSTEYVRSCSSAACLMLRAFFAKLRMMVAGTLGAERPRTCSIWRTWASRAARSWSALSLKIRWSSKYMAVVAVMSGMEPCSDDHRVMLDGCRTGPILDEASATQGFCHALATRGKATGETRCCAEVACLQGQLAVALLLHEAFQGRDKDPEVVRFLPGDAGRRVIEKLAHLRCCK